MNKHSKEAPAVLDLPVSNVKEGDIVEVITPQLIKQCKELNFKIDLRTGMIGKEVKKRGRKNKVLLKQLYDLVANGECYPGYYYDVFGYKNTPGMCEGILSKEDKRVDLLAVYPSEIRERNRQTMLEKYGVTHNWAKGKMRDELEAKWVEKYGATNPLKSKKVRDQIKQTMLDRYGVESYTESENFKPKVKQTMLDRYGVEHNWNKGQLRDNLEAKWVEKYGVDNPIKSDEVQNRMKSTCLERYGVAHPLQNADILRETKETLFERYGVYYPIQSPEIAENMRRTMLDRYGVDYYMNIPGAAEETARKIREAIASKDPRYAKIYDWLTNGYEDENEVIEFLTTNYDYNSSLKYLKMLGLKSKTEFLTELKVRRLLDLIGVDYLCNVKAIHSTRNANDALYELDIFIPELGVGIEANGKAYHAVNKAAYGEPKSKDYHFEKFKAFHERGILMLSFTDYEQDHFRSDYENIIKHHLTGEPLNVSKAFLEFNQISSIEESLNYGLFDPSRFTGNFEDHQHQRFIEDYEYWDCGIIK